MVKSLRLAFAMAMMCFAVVANAETKSYTENLVVTINEESTEPQPTTIDVTILENGNIDFTLKNFALASEDGAVPVGNIAINNLVLTDEGYCKSFSFEGSTLILAGDDPNYGAEEWLGPMLPEIPMKLTGKMTDDKLYVTIDIDMQDVLGQVIYVKLGEDITEPEGPAVISSKDYTENLVVTINEISTDPQPTTVVVETLENGNINFTLKNFALVSEEGAVPVGNISINNIPLTDEGYCKSMAFEGSTFILAGDDPNFGAEEWLGPMLPEIPMKLTGKLTEDKLYVTIDIDMQDILGQLILVKLGEDILNPVEVSISKVANSVNTNVVYDLMGRRVNNTVKGNIYIENGKKVMK